MSYKADNAVILAAGMSSRFVPLSFEYPKALINVRGEVLIERQIRQLREAGISEIIIVAGYKIECFYYLKEKYKVIIVENKEYQGRNNHSSIYAARHYLKNSYICSADNYYVRNLFETEVDEPYYAAAYADGMTKEWCLKTDELGWITGVSIGGTDSWYMLGHAFWNKEFSRKFTAILEAEYAYSRTKDKFWESIYKEHIGQLDLKIRKYDPGQIFEFDTLDELRIFDDSYRKYTRSIILKEISRVLKCGEDELSDFKPIYDGNHTVKSFLFRYKGKKYLYDYEKSKLESS